MLFDNISAFPCETTKNGRKCIFYECWENKQTKNLPKKLKLVQRCVLFLIGHLRTNSYKMIRDKTKTYLPKDRKRHTFIWSVILLSLSQLCKQRNDIQLKFKGNLISCQEVERGGSNEIPRRWCCKLVYS